MKMDEYLYGSAIISSRRTYFVGCTNIYGENYYYIEIFPSKLVNPLYNEISLIC
ncbi:hypothetical protein DFR64_1217 [Pelolinea submarina]|uniref:Uncharacterized protein n=1 Tax=Pelolinea submarina TaxID=913107 RepID=A0A3E0AI28_9CHLR|nr:hypothetical protein DFR64_1217 [Pelolinea submarina]